jgi:hypothetical protein
MAGRMSIEEAQRDLGTDEHLTGAFKAAHRAPAEGIDYAAVGILGLIGGLLSLPRRTVSPKWVPLDGVPKRVVTVGVTKDEVLIGRRGTTFLRLPLDDAFGDAHGPLADAWIEVGGVRLVIGGANADEAMRIWRQNRPKSTLARPCEAQRNTRPTKYPICPQTPGP